MILIIQNGYFKPGITKYLNEKYTIIKSFTTNVSDINLDSYFLVIILGGNQSILNINAYPYLHNVINLINKCILNKKPLLGICLGSQLIAYSLGCEIKKCQKNNIGYDTNILNYTNIFRNHSDYLVPNNSITVLEYFNDMPYFYQYNNNVYGLQCHPDIDPDYVHNYTSNMEIINYARNNKDEINNNNKNILEKLIAIAKIS